ncbi:MAG: GNAT family N-acetyltransferase [Oscillospiraceae bacterium]|nr:GNAT family N-acetyltransferase [Oscillospiraceae bacterium]
MILETPRLILRPWEEKDYEDYREYFDDPELWHMMGYAPFVREADYRADFVRRLDDPGQVALQLRENGCVVGHIAASALHPPLTERSDMNDLRGLSLSFALTRYERGRGLMTEALSALLDRLFAVDGLDYVNSGFFFFNTASRALHERLGFRPLFTHTIERGGETIEVCETILTREDWRSV